MIGCPNKSSEEYKEAVSRLGSDELAYAEWAKNGFDFPSAKKEGFYSLGESFKPNDKELDDKVSGFLKQIGVDVKIVKSIKDESGKNLDTNAVANLLTKTIDVVDGQAKLDTLPEEASHFLVQILKQNGSPLYNSMKSELESYDIYKQTLQEYNEVYKGNIDKIKDEAIGKIVASQIVDKFEQDNKKSRVATWFNRIMNFAKEKLGLINRDELDDAIIKNNPFSEAADLIYRRNSTNFKFSDDWTPEESEKYYQLKQPKQIEDNIRNKFDVIGGVDGGRYSLVKDGKETEIKNRVSDKRKNDTPKSKEYAAREEVAKAVGQNGLKDLSNIVSRIVSTRDEKISPARVVKTNEEVYNTLERYVQQMIKDLPSDARIIVNQPIYSPKTDTASTPSMMIIHPDGKVDVLKWLFTNLTKQGVSKTSRNEALDTLQAQKKILNEGYGITNFGKVRAIPVGVDIRDGLLTSIRTGDQTFKASPELDPIPISEELTGNEKLDRVISTLLVKKSTWEKAKSSVSNTEAQRDEFNERKYAELQKIDKAIRDIQLKQDVKEFVNIGLSAIQELASTPINQYSQDRIYELQKTMTFYGKDMIDLVAEQVKDFSDADKSELSRLVTESQLYNTNINQDIARRLLETTGRENLNDAQNQTGIYTRIFRTASQQQNPIIQSFWRLVTQAKTKTRDAVTELNGRIKDAVEDLKKAQSGIDSGKLFDFMLKRNSSGALQVVSKFDSEFYRKLIGARQDTKDVNNLNFLKKNLVFDKEAYEQAYENKKASLQNVYKFDTDKEAKIEDRLSWFRDHFSDSPRGYANSSNFYMKIKEDGNLYSKEYKNIVAKPELKAFYDLWMSESKKFQDYIGKDLGGRFVWNVHNDLIDSFRENGWGAFTNMSSILDHLESRPGEALGMIDPETGRPTYELPAYYTDRGGENQSKDLGKVLSLVAAMANNHRYMGEIETTSKMLELAMENQPEIQTDSQGNPIRNKLTNAVSKAVGSASNLDQYRNAMNYYVYGVRNKTKDFILNKENIPFYKGDREFSTLRSIDLLKNWFVGKSLSMNPVSIVAHSLRGMTNVRIIGAMGKFFDNGEYNKAVAKLVAKDGKFFSIAGYFDLMHGENYARKAQALSASKLGQVLNYENMFIGHRRTDYVVRNSILGAMLESHTYDEASDKIVKKTSDDQKSVSDLIGIKNDKLDFGNISKDALDAFRNRVHAVGDKVFGMNTRDDINLAHLTILGRALMTFRNWIPGMVDVRYRALSHNEDLGDWELGRYRSFWNNVITKQFHKQLWDTIRGFGVFGYGGKFGDRSINRAKELYAQYMEKNPFANITEAEYVDLHLSNLKASMAEVYITLAMMGAALALKPDKGEKLEQGSIRKYMVRQINRSLADIQFFYNPKEFDNIIKSPIPVVQSYLEPLHLMNAFWDKGEEALGGHPKEKKGELRRAVFQAVPGLNGFESLLSFTQDNYDKTKTEGTDSGSQ